MKRLVLLFSLLAAVLSASATLDGARWIGALSLRASGIPEGRWSNMEFKKDSFKALWAGVDTLSARSIVLRRSYRARRAVASATVSICGLGHYELRLNGRKVGDSEFAPLWSEYDKTVYYNTYDVTSQLVKGRNSILVLLGNGMFNVQRGSRYSKLQHSYGPPQLIFRLDVTYADGSREVLVSDDEWQWALSPITFNSIYGGESYDARLENPREWHRAVLTEGPRGTLTLQTAPPVKVMEHYDVASWWYIPSDSLAAASQATKRTVARGAFVCDMGQNLAGFPEITVSGKPGQRITLLVSETLTPQRACNQRQTGRQHYYEYTIGEGKSGDWAQQDDSSENNSAAVSSRSIWHPRFSYYGFRYIQVEGAVLEGEPNPDALPVIHRLRSCFVYNSAPEVSAFACSNERFTRAHRLIERAERSNMQAVFTDCPHREKLGWLEQTHLCGPSLFYNYDLRDYIPKIVRDICDTAVGRWHGANHGSALRSLSATCLTISRVGKRARSSCRSCIMNTTGDSSLTCETLRCDCAATADYLTSRADSGAL